MKFITTSSFIVLFTVFFGSTFAEATKYVLVEESLAKIYKELDPKSPLVKQAKKGDYLELIYDGTSWNKVKVDGQEGWIERRAGKIVESQGGAPIGLIIFFVLAGGGVLGFIGVQIAKNNKGKMAVEVDEV
jgi:hypothetical protein